MPARGLAAKALPLPLRSGRAAASGGGAAVRTARPLDSLDLHSRRVA